MSKYEDRPYAPDVWKAHSDEQLQEFINETTKRIMTDAYHMALQVLPQYERERMLGSIANYITDAQKELDRRKAIG